MERVMLARTQVAVTRWGFGAAVIAGLFSEVSEAQALDALEAAWASGVRYFDTAPHYGAGLSEVRLGAFLRTKPRGEFVLSTKVGRRLEPWDGQGALESAGFFGALQNVRVLDFSGDGVRRQLDASLNRLGLDHVDIVYVHDPDDHADEALAGALPALIELRSEGAVGAIGTGMNQWQIPSRFIRESDIDVVMLAGRYTLLDQSADESFLPLCVERGVSVVAAGVFNSGVLTNPRPGAHFDYAEVPDHILERALAFKALCESHGVPLAAAAAQFPLRHPAVASVVLGIRNANQASSCAELMRQDIPPEVWSGLADLGVRIPETQR